MGAQDRRKVLEMAQEMRVNYTYYAWVIRVVDGDTFDLDLELGLRMNTENRFRLRGANCPELRGPERDLGRACKQEVERIFAEVGEPLVVRTYKADSFGRWLCDIQIGDTSLARHLIREGWAIPWYGVGSRPQFNLESAYPLHA